MDALDLSIYREMVRDKVLWWGSLDPRVSAETLAARVGVARSTVRARIARWRREGFLQGYDVVPNPCLLGARIAGGNLRVDDVRQKPAVLERLALVDGAFGCLDHVGPWMALGLVEDTKAGLERRRKLVASLPGVDEVSPCKTMNTPVCTRALTPLDWRIVRALREAPDGAIGEAAARVGVSAKTFGRRYAELVKARAVWFLPRVDFARAGGTVFRVIVFLEEDADARAVLRRLGRLHELLSIEDTRDVSDFHAVSVYTLAASAATIEETQREALAIPGVKDVEAVIPRRGELFPAWIDEQLERVTR